jgi:hypothetical protein
MTTDEELRAQAIRRIRAKQSFQTHFAVYLVVNALLIAIWFFTSRDYFWPIWPMLGWGIGIFFHWFGISKQLDITEDRIQEEMNRLRGGTER